MQWPGITPARLNNAVAPQEGSRPFGPQGIPSDDFFPGAPSSRYFCCLRVYGCHAALHRGSAWTWTFHQGLAIAGRAVEQADLRCRLVT